MKTLSSTVAIRREYIPDLIGVYTRAATWQPTEAAVTEFQAAAARRSAPPARGVAGIALHGVILRRPGIIEQMLGAASLDGFMAQFRAAVADPEIGTIVLSIDSPGGETSGLPEAAAEIRAARASKSIVASVESMACSAAYWIASQASEIVAEPSAIIGNIGVYLIHDDISAALESAGIKREILASSETKAALAEGGTLTDEARDQLMAIVNEQEGMFVTDVSKGRGVTAAKVRKEYGNGGIFGANAALTAGMVDRIDTLDGVVRKAVSRRVAATLEGVTVNVSAANVTSERQIPDPTPDPSPIPEPVPHPTADLDMARLRQRAHAH